MRWKKKSILWVWILSYIVVLLIPIITVILNHRISMQTIRQEYMRVNELTLQNVKEKMDYYFSAERRFYVYAFLDESFIPIRYTNKIDNDFYNNAREYQNELLDYDRAIKEKSCMVYLEDQNWIIGNLSMGGIFGGHSALQQEYGEVISFEEWYGLLNGEFLEDSN